MNDQEFTKEICRRLKAEYGHALPLFVEEFVAFVRSELGTDAADPLHRLVEEPQRTDGVNKESDLPETSSGADMKPSDPAALRSQNKLASAEEKALSPVEHRLWEAVNRWRAAMKEAVDGGFTAELMKAYNAASDEKDMAAVGWSQTLDGLRSCSKSWRTRVASELRLLNAKAESRRTYDD